MQPCAKSTLTAKGSQLAKRLEEDFLREILSLRSVSSHPQAHSVDSAMMSFEEFLEGLYLIAYYPWFFFDRIFSCHNVLARAA
jgi:hypothetical protein